MAAIPRRRPFAGAAAFGISTSDGFTGWLAERGIGLVFVTDDGGRFYSVGLDDDGGLSVFERALDRPLALAALRGTLYMATRDIVWRFDNVLRPGQRADGCDALYAPQVGYVTGDIAARDLAVAGDGRIYAANGRSDAVVRVEAAYSFAPLWFAPPVDRLAADDRCHVTGLALDGDTPRYATVAGRAERREGWREGVADGGALHDIVTGAVVVEGLSLPHSPRRHDGKLWLLDSGSGHIGHVDETARAFRPAALCPGFPRGLDFVAGEAVVGLSKPWPKTPANPLPLYDRFAETATEGFCGLAVVDLERGEVRHWLRLDSAAGDVTAVACLPGIRRPVVVAPGSAESARVFFTPPAD